MINHSMVGAQASENGDAYHARQMFQKTILQFVVVQKVFDYY